MINPRLNWLIPVGGIREFQDCVPSRSQILRNVSISFSILRSSVAAKWRALTAAAGSDAVAADWSWVSQTSIYFGDDGGDGPSVFQLFLIHVYVLVVLFNFVDICFRLFVVSAFPWFQSLWIHHPLIPSRLPNQPSSFHLFFSAFLSSDLSDFVCNSSGNACTTDQPSFSVYNIFKTWL